MKKEIKKYNEYKKKMIQLKKEFLENAEEELLGEVDNSYLKT